MRKETLTREKIKIDIKNACINDIKRSLPFTLYIAIPSILLILYAHREPSSELSIFLYIFVVFAISHALIRYAVFLYKKLRIILKVSKDEFNIQIDKLLYAEELSFWDYRHSLQAFRLQTLRSRLFFKPFVLQFSSYDKFSIPRGKNYVWSDLFCMSDKDIYNSSVLGDEFYLAVIEHKTVVMVYNTKRFELIDQKSALNQID